jgi:hypothetical protein
MIAQLAYVHTTGHDAALHASYQPLNDPHAPLRSAVVRDVSPNAIRLNVTRPSRIGRVLSLSLSSPHRTRPLRRLVLVVGVRSHSAGWTIIGLFTDPLREEEWLSLQADEIHV